MILSFEGFIKLVDLMIKKLGVTEDDALAYATEMLSIIANDGGYKSPDDAMDELEKISPQFLL